MEFVIESLTRADFGQLDEMMKAAYKVNFSRKRDLARYLAIQPSYPLVAKESGEAMGFGAVVDYGPFSYIGLMAVSPKFQRRGVGGAVLRKLVEWSNARNCPTILLDASKAGEPLYEKNGFLGLDSTHVLKQTARSSDGRAASQIKSVNIYRPDDLEDIVSFDVPCFGADRRKLLLSFFEEFPERSLVSRDEFGSVSGFIVAQTRSIGPWVVKDSSAAEALLSRVLELPFEDDPSVILSSLNVLALDLLGRFGFEIQRSNRHMYMGKKIERARSTTIYAQATMGFG